MNDTVDMQPPHDATPLNEVSSGKSCMLVGIIRRGGFRKHGRHHRHHKEHGFLKEIFDESRRRKKHGGFFKHMERRHEKHEGRELRGFRKLRILRRLLDLGITKGCTFTVIAGSDVGPVLVEVRGTRVALGQGLASQMLVKVVDT